LCINCAILYYLFNEKKKENESVTKFYFYSVPMMQCKIVEGFLVYKDVADDERVIE
jgi:hypothetical protein